MSMPRPKAILRSFVIPHLSGILRLVCSWPGGFETAREDSKFIKYNNGGVIQHRVI